MSTEHFTTRPLTAHDVQDTRALPASDAQRLIVHLRWCLHTPYAEAWGVFSSSGLCALATLVHYGSSAHVGRFVAAADTGTDAPGLLLVEALLRVLHDRACPTLTVEVRPKYMAFWQRAGFVELDAFYRYAHGTFLEATHDEVALLRPAHTMALLRLDRRATGEDRRSLLLEHPYAAHSYVVHGHVRGVLLPLLGNGLIVAEDADVGLELQRWLLPTQHRISVPEGNRVACDHLAERDYDVVGMRVRMVWGVAPVFRAEQVFAWP